MTQSKFAHEKSLLKSLKGALLSARDTFLDQCSLSVDVHKFHDTSLQQSFDEWFMTAFHHVTAKKSVFQRNRSERCKSLITTVGKRNEVVCLFIAEGLDHAGSLAEFDVPSSSTGTSSPRCDCSGDASESVSASGWRIMMDF